MLANRRQFSRIRFQAAARLILPDAELAVAVADLSLRGALVDAPAGIFIPMGTPCTLKIHLDGEGVAIRMEATAVHREGGKLGLHCREIDLDSVTHLRRLVELNLGDEALLHRELSRLAAG